MNQEERIAAAVAAVSATADLLPSAIIIHRLRGRAVQLEYMSASGLKIVNRTLDELKTFGEDYHTHFLNPHDAREYEPKILELLTSREEDRIVTFFQQVRHGADQQWHWYLSSGRILLRSDDGTPLLLIFSSVPIDPLLHVTPKVARLLEENNFIRTHYQAFTKLSEREKCILRLLAEGKSNRQIAEAAFISINTVETHRKKIKAKLGVRSTHELRHFAQAFELNNPGGG